MTTKTLYQPGVADHVAIDKVDNIAIYNKVKLAFGVDGTATDVSTVNPLPVSGTFVVTPGGPFPYPPNADAFVASYPNAVTEVYTYKSGGIAGTVISILTVVYTSADKTILQSGVWT